MKDKPTGGKHGGARANSGRPKGSMNKATKKKKAVEEEFKQKVMRSATRLFNAQMAIAEGVKYLWRIDKDKDGKKEKPVIVTDPDEIEEFLADEIDSGSYYYISTEKPDNRAIDSFLDRLFGRAVQSTDITSGGKPLTGPIPLVPKRDGKILDTTSETTESPKT